MRGVFWKLPLVAIALSSCTKEVPLTVGSSVPAFTVLDITGPSKGKPLCYV